MSYTDPEKTAAWLAQEARQAGFSHVALWPIGTVPHGDFFAAWLKADHAGEMTYLHASQAERADPRLLLSRARSILCAALSYVHPEPEIYGLRGQIARYARSEDYHLVFKQRLEQLAQGIMKQLDHAVAYRICVDTAPLLEREIAAQAGLGFQGKNTLLIIPGVGSYTVLGELLLPLAVPPPTPMAPRCGQCRLCLDACPTGALIDEYHLDARRCISYLTIEHTGPIPVELRPLMGTWIFGCDACQEVCPYNAAAPPGDPALKPLFARSRPELVRLLRLGAAQFRKFVQRTALRRVHRAQLLRNVAVALGNAGTAEEVPPLVRALAEPSPLVREHVAWALSQIAAREPAVREQVQTALGELAGETDRSDF